MLPKASGLTRSFSSPAYVVVFESDALQHVTNATDRKTMLQARDENFEYFVTVELERFAFPAATVRVGLLPRTFPASGLHHNCMLLPCAVLTAEDSAAIWHWLACRLLSQAC